MLRRIAASLRRQDWLAVAVELVVVVVGVFIGVQASNWNAQRETNQKAAVFTHRLKADLRKEAWVYELHIGYYNQVLANAKRTADALTGNAPVSDEALLVAAYRATQFRGYDRYRATYDELTSTGQIGLIRDPALRDLAMRLYTEPWLDQFGRPERQRQYRNAFRKAVPYAVQQRLAAKCGDRETPVGDYRAIAQVLDYPCTTGLPPETIAAVDARLRHDPRIIALLRLRIADIETDLANFTGYWDQDFHEPLRRLAQEKP